MELFDFNEKMSKSINELLRSLLKLSLKSPSQAGFIYKAIAAQKKAAERRQLNEVSGLHVPSFMIASITHRCNLQCKGCYAHAQKRKSSSEINFSRMKSMIGEARDLGISIVLLAGGEPLILKDEIISMAQEYKDVIFPVFTNGLLINESVIKDLRKAKNVIPIISIEGLEKDTDFRRGEGVYRKTRDLFKQLNGHGVFYGTSITVTSDNIGTATDEDFIKNLVEDGCKLFFFVEYVPVEKGTEHLVLNESDRNSLMERLNIIRDKYPAFFIAFPGDEKEFGGCLASGKGFIHISPEGDVEPCPFAPFSDSNIGNKSLKECLESDFLTKIRDNHELLAEGQGGCALWEKRELVEAFLLKDKQQA